MTFSGALTLTDLNDFITPSQACIKPVEQVKPKDLRKEPGAAASEILIDGSGTYYEVSQASGPGRRLEQAQISLNDCLACSGCITSAESVLISLQSHEEVLNFLEANSKEEEGKKKIPVISIAPQVLASLAASVAASSEASSSSSSPPVVTPLQILRRLRVFLKHTLGFSHIFDTTFARELALREHVKEFQERREKASQQSGKENRQPGDEEKGHFLPMLASACPGWICYAEKTHAEMMPFIANTKSPQQVMGTLVKEWMGKKWGKRADGIYHVCVMPCYDKKLEASRSDFYNELYATRDVDCVITTGELDAVLKEKGWDLSIAVDGEMNAEPELLPELIEHPGTSSGSYLQAVIDHLTKTSEMPLELSVKQIRNADYEEYELRQEDGQVVFKGAKCYGFRNLQNVVRKVGKESGVRVGIGAAGKLGGRVARKREKDEAPGQKLEYIEVMACPTGCVNGGGQLKAVGDGAWGDGGVKWGNREWTKRVEAMYWETGGNPDMSPELLREIEDAGLGLRTSYRAVESNVVGLAVKW